MFGSESDTETGCMYYVVRDIRNGNCNAAVIVTDSHSDYSAFYL